MKRAALIAVGTELLRFGRLETNTAWIAERLERLGVEVSARLTVADETDTIEAAVRAAVAAADLVVLTGGLGPTEDDRTRDAVARALGRALERDAAWESLLRGRLEAYGVPWSDLQARQALKPAGAVWIENRRGSAAGWSVEVDGTLVVALPGVPSEMRPMVEQDLGAWSGGEGGSPAAVCLLRIAGLGEGAVDDLLRDLYAVEGVDVTTLGSVDGVDVRLRSPDAARMEGVRSAIAERLGPRLYAEGERRLAEVVGELLLGRGETLAVAESCTGGKLGAAATDVAGSSAWFRGGWIVYDNALKRDWAGVEAATLEREGAVSEPVARRLAEAVRREAAADWGIGVTGVAGPDGGTEDKPVGLVHVALAAKTGTRHWEKRFPGDRAQVRRRTVAFCLDRLRLALSEPGG